ncbi:MAG TPA: hypothetical protein PKV71_14800 [Calditrichia bacterium]|nr:hypothetical protein [Calditrichota bacterium]HQU72115.1 hypothetical protein [Calditrichia bacterium]HQV33152.1 hypothetical protein [Calditrichia bacterium]
MPKNAVFAGFAANLPQLVNYRDNFDLKMMFSFALSVGPGGGWKQAGGTLSQYWAKWQKKADFYHIFL